MNDDDSVCEDDLRRVIDALKAIEYDLRSVKEDERELESIFLTVNELPNVLLLDFLSVMDDERPDELLFRSVTESLRSAYEVPLIVTEDGRSETADFCTVKLELS